MNVRLLTLITNQYLANARVAGLQTDLKLKNGRYQLAISIFFLGYVLFQLP